MLKVLVPAVGLLGAVAFAAQPATPVLEVQENPAPMGWHLHHEGSLAKLAYGVANSDQLVLMMTCAPGDRAAVVYGDVQMADARLERASYVQTAPDPLSGGEAFESRVSLSSPALEGLAEGRGVRLEGQAGTRLVRTTDTEREAVADFLSHCGSGKV